MARDGEKLDKANMLRVIELLGQEKPITKKAACEILNISYNTPRLKKLVEEFKTKEANIKRRRAKLRGKPLTGDDLAIIASDYLNGDAIATIADLIFRSTAIVKKAVLSLNIPLRDADANYHNPYFIADEAIAEDYELKDLVYSARYQCPATIENISSCKDGKVYRIWLLGNEQQYAVQPYWELADLRKIQKEFKVLIKAHEGTPPSYNPKK